MSRVLILGSLCMGDQERDPGTLYNGHSFKIGNLQPGFGIPWVAANGVLYCEFNLLTGISWNELDENGLIYGKPCMIDGFKFMCRIASGADDEWAAVIDAINKDSSLLRWQPVYSWCQSSHTNYQNHKICRGGNWPQELHHIAPDKKDPRVGWRPVLEPIGDNEITIEQIPLGSDLIIWGGNHCVRGFFDKATPYDILLNCWPDKCSEKDNFFTIISDEGIAVNREKIQLLQIGKPV